MSYYWPHMGNEIKNMVKSCPECQTLQPAQQKETLQPTSYDFPMHRVGADLFQLNGKHYLVMVDGYSGYPFVANLRSLTTSAIIDKLENWFFEFGFPANIRTDGGPQFRTEFHEWCENVGINKETSSPYFPQSNGLAESAVKNMKSLLKKCDGNFPQFRKSLLIWRNTPKATGDTPAQLLFGYTQNYGQGDLNASPFVDRDAAKERKNKESESQERSYNKNAKDLDELLPGQRVLLRNPASHTWDAAATIVKKRSDGRSYVAEDEEGYQSVRNRRDIRPLL